MIYDRAHMLHDARFLLALLTLVAMSGFTMNAILIWAFNPGRELVVWQRALLHAAGSLYLLRRFVGIVRAEAVAWDLETVTTGLVSGLLALAAILMALTIMRQIDYDRAERIRFRQEARERLRRRQERAAQEQT